MHLEPLLILATVQCVHTKLSWRESNPVPHFGGPIRCFFLCLLCLASARLHQTKQKSLEYCSSKCACSFYGADFRPSKTSAAGNTDVFPRLITQRGRKSARKNRHGFNSRQLKSVICSGCTGRMSITLSKKPCAHVGYGPG